MGMQIGEKHAQKSYYNEPTQTNTLYCSGMLTQPYGHPHRSVAFSSCFNSCLDIFSFIKLKSNRLLCPLNLCKLFWIISHKRELVWNGLTECQCRLHRLIRRDDARRSLNGIESHNCVNVFTNDECRPSVYRTHPYINRLTLITILHANNVNCMHASSCVCWGGARQRERRQRWISFWLWAYENTQHEFSPQ